ncbi:MAG: methyltransferase domain-containing protein [Planctomycetota bacterium]|nr:methyltransferase domain-containing protein [Planctomycetota bacterium]
MSGSTRSQSEVTYELFDINPAEFYKQRFLTPAPLPPTQENMAIRTVISYNKINRLVDAIRKNVGADEFKVLEVGCGSGPIGARVKHNFPQCKLYGVDLSAECVEVARRDGFDEAVACDVFSGLPYEDEAFDFVFTMDFWGHIEFAKKDQIIAEAHRVTRKGGLGWHGIEAGFVDYFGCNPKDPEDYVRKYVYTEGHIGVETLEANVERFSRWFEVVGALPWPIKPFASIDSILAGKRFGEGFNEAFLPYDGQYSRICADVVMGYCSEYVLDRLIEAFGPVLTKGALAKLGLGTDMAKFAELFVQGSGFAMLTVQKPG